MLKLVEALLPRDGTIPYLRFFVAGTLLAWMAMVAGGGVNPWWTFVVAGPIAGLVIGVGLVVFWLIGLRLLLDIVRILPGKGREPRV